MKIMTFYLPQFHEIPENNDAWGHGFTEWTNVKKGERLFDGQRQPRVPLNDNYYNLLDTKVMEWQAMLAKEAGISGFCFYHYWFQGRMVLETPIHNLLEDKSIDMKFCFSWANEPWTKTWHGAGGNKEILIPQTYGGKEEWEAHYNYFLPYFKDPRYILEGNKPVLLIYRLRNIPDFNEMIRYWNKRAKEDEFDGIYLISMNVSREHVYMSKWVNASVDFEPNRTKYELHSDPSGMEGKCMDYIELNEKMLNVSHKREHFRTVYVDYDDTPRRGKRGVFTRNVGPDRFGEYLKRALEISRGEGNEYLFINAWNEWGEGNYLEPDTVYKYEYLRKVCEAVYGKEQADKSTILGCR